MKTIKYIILFAIVNLHLINLYADTISINNSYTTDTVFTPFSVNQIYGLNFTGRITLNSDTSLARLIMITQTGEEFMLYEAYPLIVNEMSFDISEICDETCYLDGIIADNLRLEIINAEIEIDYLNTTESYVMNANALQIMEKRNNDFEKLEILNANIAENGFYWIAGDNSFVEQFYSQKKDSWSEKYNLKGYDYYIGGVYEAAGENYANVPTTNYIHAWDWRNRHGANNPSSSYFDGDIQYGSGWLTPSKDQEACGSCGVFSTLGSLEATLNLYYNQQLDFDLSEQQQISCNPMVSCSGGWPFEVFSYIRDNYVVEEACYEYLSTDGNCNDVCTNPETKVSIGSITEHWMDQYLTIEDVQLMLKQYGPLSWVKDGGAHAVTLVGWLYDSNEERINLIYKDNLGPDDWGIGGFAITPAPSMFVYVGVAHDPIFLTNNTPNQLLLDEDGDGYDNWGIGPRPVGASNYIDCDDNNPFVGPFAADFSCQCLANFNNTPIIINSHVNWTDDVALEQPIIINAGGELTITSQIFIQEDVSIKVNPGGKLTIDGGILTKACYAMWKGIEVIGNSSLPQLPHSNQGVLVVENNARIEYAETAVLLGATNPFSGELDYNKSGGILITKDSEFLNNINDIMFLPYFDSQYITNESYFRNTTFKTNDTELLMFTPENHIEINGVYGIDIKGCNFMFVEPNLTTQTPPDNRGTGILVIDASINATEGCTTDDIYPCQELVPSTFINLRYGIRAFNTGPNLLFSVNECKFSKNIAGIYLSGYNQAKIYNNVFYTNWGLLLPDEIEDPFYGGLYLDGCSGYTVEENEFFGDYMGFGLVTQQKIGLYVKNSGGDDNEIYNNSFHHLVFSIIAEGINKGEDSGLTIKCNDAFDNLNDFYVIDNPDVPRPKGLIGIKQMQGADINNTEMMAANTFTDWFDGTPAFGNNLWNYNNQGDNFTYFHHAPNIYFQVHPLEDNYTDGTITLINPYSIIYDKNDACPSHIGGGGERVPIATADINITNFENQLIELTDGGDTDATNNDIEFSQTDEGLELRNRLIDDSPYLSDTVIKSAIEKEDVLLNAMLRDVLVENPQAAKKEEILDAIEDRNNEMPGYMMNEILEGKETVGSKEVLESKLAFWNNERERAVNSLIRGFMADTLNNAPFDSIIAVFEQEESVGARYRLAFSYADKEELLSAESLISGIPIDFELNSFQGAVNDAYSDYFDILYEMQTDTLLAKELDSTNVEVLTGIMESELPLVSAYARGMLVKGGHISFRERIVLPSSNKSKRVYNNDRPEPMDESIYLKLMPNPAKNFVIAEYDLSLGQGQGMLVLSDLKGTILYSIVIKDTKNQITFDLGNLSAGLYVISLYSGNNHIESKQFSKVK